MRSARSCLAAAVAALAFAGCAGSSGSGIFGGPPNQGGGQGAPQTVVGAPGGTGGVTVPANTFAPRLLDDGTVGTTGTLASVFVGYNVTASDAQSATQAPQDAAAAPPAFPPPPNPSGPSDGGSHAVTFTGSGSPQIILTNNKTYNFTYAFGGQTFDYGTVVVHLLGGAGSITTPPPTVSLELTGGTGPAAFDVRVGCTNPATTPASAALTASFARYNCPLPAYGSLTSNFQGNNPVVPGATGAFTPTAAKFFIVLTYPTATSPVTSALLGIDYIYVVQ